MMRPPTPSVLAQIAALPNMTMDELRALWMNFNATPPMTQVRTYIERRLAYQLQEAELSAKEKQQAEENLKRIRSIGERKIHPSDPAKLAPGTVLTRTFGEHDHHVTVVGPKDFEYRGRRYGSLSRIAREITGTRWNGPLFFGLRKAAKKKDKRS